MAYPDKKIRGPKGADFSKVKYPEKWLNSCAARTEAMGRYIAEQVAARKVAYEAERQRRASDE